MVRKRKQTLEHEPSAEWLVSYLVKPEYQVFTWRGQAPNKLMAEMFASRQLFEEGYVPARISHMKTERMN